MNQTKNLSPHQQDLRRALMIALPVVLAVLVFCKWDGAYLLPTAFAWLPVLINMAFRPKPFF